jgi:hypothetical protein
MRMPWAFQRYLAFLPSPSFWRRAAFAARCAARISVLSVPSVRVSVSVSVPDSDTLTDTVGLKWTRRRVGVDTPEGWSGHAGGLEWTRRRVGVDTPEGTMDALTVDISQL